MKGKLSENYEREVCINPNPQLRVGCNTRSVFLSPRLVVILRVKSSVRPTTYPQLDAYRTDFNGVFLLLDQLPYQYQRAWSALLFTHS